MLRGPLCPPATDRQQVHPITCELCSRWIRVIPRSLPRVSALLPDKTNEEHAAHFPGVWLEQRQPLIPQRLRNKPLRLSHTPSADSPQRRRKPALGSGAEFRGKEGSIVRVRISKNTWTEALVFTASPSSPPVRCLRLSTKTEL